MVSNATLSAIIGSIILLLYFCILLNWTCVIFFLRNNADEIAHRRPYSSIVIGIAGLLSTIQGIVSLIIINVNGIPSFHGRNTLLVFLIYCMLQFRRLLRHDIQSVHMYIIYFDIKFNKALSSAKWRLYIDPNDNNWFLRHRRTFGSPQKAAIAIFSVWLLWTVTGCSAYIASGDKVSSIGRGIFALAAMCATVANICLFFKMPKFNDLFFIRNEVRLMISVQILSLVLYAVIGAFVNVDHGSVGFAVLIVMGISFAFVISGCALAFALYKFRLPTTAPAAWRFAALQRIEREEPSFSSRNSSFKGQVHLRRILEEKHGFEAFAKHLMKEFCVENFLYFIETQQWLRALLEKDRYRGFGNVSYNGHIDIDGDAENGNGKEIKSRSVPLLAVRLSEKAPVSKIVTDGSEMKEGHEYVQCVLLFKKFISNDAYFCVNISGGERERLYWLFGYSDYGRAVTDEDMRRVLEEKCPTAKELFSVWDESRKQCFGLLRSSCVRFQNTSEFDKLEMVL